MNDTQQVIACIDAKLRDYKKICLSGDITEVMYESLAHSAIYTIDKWNPTLTDAARLEVANWLWSEYHINIL